MFQQNPENQTFNFNFDIRSSLPIDENLLCMMCHKILINAYQALCGCKFCQNCCKELQIKKEKLCPICQRGEIASMNSFQIDHKTNSKVSTIVMKCPNMFCDYECEMALLKDHINNCLQLNENSFRNETKTNSFSRTSGNQNFIKELENKISVLADSDKQTKLEVKELMRKLETCDQELDDFRERFNQNQLCWESLQQTVENLKGENENLKRLLYRDNLVTLSPTYDLHKPKPFLWRVTEFSKKQKDAQMTRKKVIFSDPFYSNYNGYKICLGMYPNGVKQYEGKYLFVFFCILPSQNDNNLSWPMQHEISLSILDHNSLKTYKIYKFKYTATSKDVHHSFSKPESDLNNGIGDNEFISFKELKSLDNILKNDTILIQCIVNPK